MSRIRALLAFLALILGVLPLSAGGPPVFSAPLLGHTLEVGQPTRHLVPLAKDPEGSGVSYAMKGLPKGLVFDESAMVV